MSLFIYIINTFQGITKSILLARNGLIMMVLNYEQSAKNHLQQDQEIEELMKNSYHYKQNVCKPSKFSINVLSANSDNIKQNQGNRSLLHQSYTVCDMLRKSKPDTKPESINGESRIKLRDYLLLAKTAVTKAAVQKRKIIEEVHEHTNNTAKAELEIHNSKTELRKCKYGIQDKEMLQILKKEMEMQLEEGIKQMQQIRQEITAQFKQAIPSSEEMVTMYDLRAILKDNIRTSLTNMEKLIDNLTHIQKPPVLKEEPFKLETDKDAQFTNLLLNKNIERFEKQLKNRFSFRQA